MKTIAFFFKDKGNNYIFALLLLVIFYFIFMGFFIYIINLENTMNSIFDHQWFSPNYLKFLSLVLSVLLIKNESKIVSAMTKEKLLFFGIEVNDGNSAVWLDSGPWILPVGFSTFKSEKQKTENRDVVLKEFECQAYGGKVIKGDANGEWKITNPENFKQFDESKMDLNLQTLIRRTFTRICAALKYDDITKENMGREILQDETFINNCNEYGIQFVNLIATGVAKNLEQENINHYIKESIEEQKSHYPEGYDFSKKELQQMRENALIALGKTENKVLRFRGKTPPSIINQ